MRNAFNLGWIAASISSIAIDHSPWWVALSVAVALYLACSCVIAGKP